MLNKEVLKQLDDRIIKNNGVFDKRITKIEGHLYDDPKIGQMGIIKKTEQNEDILRDIQTTVKNVHIYLKWTFKIFICFFATGFGLGLAVAIKYLL